MITKESILKSVFGYDTFRVPQSEIIENVLAGKNTLALMPTGGGKSICYQLPALIKEGTAIVVSPLIALMKDQVEALLANGIPAAILNSTIPYQVQSQIEKQCIEGEIKLLYVSPEKLLSQGFIDFLKKVNISMFAIDEAHCVSFWGHDFRPEYTQLSKIINSFPGRPVVALTATADKITRKDILKQLTIEDANIFISSFDRPNLSLEVYPGTKRIQHIIEFLTLHKNEPGIIYCLSRKSTEEIAEKLVKAGFKAKHYHAGMDHEYRSTTQEQFLKDDIEIVCATIAFGMGIDKSNVRWVIHYNMPKNIESFYQEIGRAGRDGLHSKTILFYSFNDYAMQLDMLKDLPPERKELQEAKLGRMKQYAEADICRRRILISYFNEAYDRDCGNCDVCSNPPQKFEATEIAQKALSAIARTGEQISMGILIDILRGSRNKNIIDRNYQTLKTFGVGKDLRPDEWANYIIQLMNSGIIDVAYDEGHALKLNNLSWEILKKGKNVTLARFISFIEKKNKIEQNHPLKSKNEVLSDKLFDKLRKLRKELADQQNVPAYIIFTDTTLVEMAKHRPASELDMLEIQGVGHKKFNIYGEFFLKEIQNFIRDESSQGKSIQGSTYLHTLTLYNEGFNINDIASKRNLNPVTIISHLCALYEKGHKIDLKNYINEDELAKIRHAIIQVKPEKNNLKPIYEFLGGSIDYSKIRIATSLLQKEEPIFK